MTTPLVARAPAARVPVARPSNAHGAGLRLIGSRPGRPCHAIDLDRHQVLRIRDGRGVRVTAMSGTLWLTEEGGLDDVVLVAGATHRIQHTGTTIVEAHRPGRLVLERCSDTPLQGRVAVALREAAPPGPASTVQPRRLRLGATVARVLAALRRGRVAASEWPTPTSVSLATPGANAGTSHPCEVPTAGSPHVGRPAAHDARRYPFPYY